MTKISVDYDIDCGCIWCEGCSAVRYDEDSPHVFCSIFEEQLNYAGTDDFYRLTKCQDAECNVLDRQEMMESLDKLHLLSSHLVDRIRSMSNN